MMKRIFLLLTLMSVLLNSFAYTVTDSIFNRYEHDDFAFGADVSFVPQMESWGTKWLDKNGKQMDILQILKGQGINNIRLRVWTVASGASSKQEVVSMCKRAKAKGMGVMIDFHYSDTWADPGSQTIPAAWTDHSVDALAKNVYDHTYDVLSAIKEAGIIPKWVQVGNETKRGMLYPVGQTNQGGSVAFAKFVLSGYDAVKAVDPSIQVIVHLPDGHDNSLYRSIFDGLKKNGAKWDIIGLSAYPRWSHLDGPTMITKVMANINDLKQRYGTPCMIVETGHYPREAVIGNQYMVGVMDRMIKNGDLGCFYWEPESMGGYDMGAWDEATRKPTVMMDAFLGVKHTEVAWVMKTNMQFPADGQTVETGDIELQTRILHKRKGRIQSVQFYLDNKSTGVYRVPNPAETGTTVTIPFAISNASVGVHTAWSKTTDTSKNIQTSDTATFFVGESGLFEDPIIADTDKKEGTATWGVSFSAAGKYRLALKYSSPSFRSMKILLDGDSIGKHFLSAKTNVYQTIDVEIPQTGEHILQIVSSTRSGFPEMSSLRIFPLEGQAAPAQADITSVSSAASESDDEVFVYSLSGMYLCSTTQSALGIHLGERTSAVVSLPDYSFGSPVIVRKSLKP
jgi:arabinogalactan endo-1,4-beta-galactosidase